MPALDAGIHVFLPRATKTWMAGSSPAMTTELALLSVVFLFEKSPALQRQVHLVLERGVLTRGEQAGSVGDRLAQRRHPRAVVLGEIRQHVVVHELLDAGMTDAEPHP